MRPDGRQEIGWRKNNKINGNYHMSDLSGKVIYEGFALYDEKGRTYFRGTYQDNVREYLGKDPRDYLLVNSAGQWE